MTEYKIVEGRHAPNPGTRVVMISGRPDGEPDRTGRVVLAATTAERNDIIRWQGRGCVIAWDGGPRGFEFYADMRIVATDEEARRMVGLGAGVPA